ncbi:MAG: response regulator [Pseudomonadota bacterium]|nr:response regulator [Pseudomonadota bacterium]
MDDALADVLRGLFIAELEEHVASMNRELLALERAPAADQAEPLQALFRTIHTVKGAARAASVPSIEHASHKLEDLLTGMRSGRLAASPHLFELWFATTDALADIGERLASGRSLEDAPLHALMPRLALAAGSEEVAPAVADTEERAPATTSVPPLRVAAEKVDELLARSGELLVAIRRLDASGLHDAGQSGTSDARAIATAALALDEVIRRLRMIPFREGTAHLDRAARDVGASTSKDIALVIVGGDLEVDRAVLDALRDPLLHLVRNAVDHGLEAPWERVSAGKPARGTVTVTATLCGADVLVTVTDDGRGIDPDMIRAQLRRRGLPVPEDERDLVRSIFSPGFSTAAMITDVSGRGVGLDVVRKAAEELRGSIDVTAGQGTTFSVRVPLTLSTLRVLEVGVAGNTYVFPASAVRILLRVGAEDIRSVRGVATIALDGRPVPLVPLAGLLGLPSSSPLARGKVPVVVLSHGSEVALVVDELVSEREVMVKGLGPRLRGSKVVSGATLLPSGRVGLILDVPEVVARARRGSGTVGSIVAGQDAAPKRRVLLCDDSITTRSLEKSILEGAGYTVIVGVDGADAWRLLQENPGIDVVVSDVEMPRMNGFQLTETIRESPRFRHLPVILVTGLATPADRARGLAVGANAYLVKSDFDQQQLLDTIEQVT